MKKVFIIIILFHSIISNSQMIVNDAAANSTLLSQLTTAGKQLSQAENTYKAIKNSAEKIEKVNNYVNSINDAKEIFKLQKEAIKNISFVLKNINNSKRQQLNSKFSALTSDITLLINQVSKITTSGFFNMTDKERIDMITDLKVKVLSLVSTTRKYALPIKRDLAIQKKLKSLK